MQTVKLLRSSDDKVETLGKLSVGDFSCVTLERPWLDNANNVSCIPKGNYVCKYTLSNRLSQVSGHAYYTYEIIGVPNRSGVRIHSANYVNQLEGCIALGAELKDLNLDGEVDITASRDTVIAFETLMNKEPFILNIQ